MRNKVGSGVKSLTALCVIASFFFGGGVFSVFFFFFFFFLRLVFKGKGNVERKHVCQDRTFQAENFSASFIKIDQQIRKILEFKYLKTDCHGGRHF